MYQLLLLIILHFYHNLGTHVVSNIVNDGSGQVLYLLKKISSAQKTTLFTLDVFTCTKSTKSNFLHPRCFYAYKTRKKHKT